MGQAAWNVTFLCGSMDYHGATMVARDLAVELVGRGHRVDVLCAGGPLVDELQQNGVRVAILDALDGKSRDLFLTRRLAARVRREKPDLLHIQHHRLADIGSRLARACSLPYFLSVHNFPATRQEVPYARKLLRGIMAVSESVREHLVNELRLPKRLIMVVPDGLDLRRFSIPPGGTTGNSVVGTIGPLEPGRGHDTFLEVAARVRKKREDTQFLLIGEGGERESLRRRAEELDLARNLVFLPDPARYFDVLRTVDVFVFACEREGLGFGVLQAMACGRPVVACGGGGVVSLLRDGQTGYLGAADPDTLATRVLSLLENPLQAEEMGRTARVRVEAEFNSVLLADRVLALYDREE